jgi:hypothetical protein
MNKRIRSSHLLLSALVAMSLASCAAINAPAPASGNLPSGQVAILAGSKTIDGADNLDIGSSEPINLGDQGAFGIEYSPLRAGFGLETGLFFSTADDLEEDTGVTVSLDVLEITLGGRYTFTEFGPILPYFGGGLDLISANVSGELNGTEVSVPLDSELGFYIHGGVSFLLGESFLIGIDIRSVSGTDELDSTQVAAVIGFGV